MARNGKIAHLPADIREQLNRRLRDGEKADGLVEWLNSRREVRAIMKAEFHGEPVKKQNLSQWRQGGYRDWLRNQEACDLLRQFSEEADALETATGGVDLSKSLSTLLAAELAGFYKKLLEETADPKERWARLMELLQKSAQLRREDHKAAQLRFKEEERDWKREQEQEQELKKVESKKALAPFWAEIVKNGMLNVLESTAEKEARLRKKRILPPLPKPGASKPVQPKNRSSTDKNGGSTADVGLGIQTNSDPIHL